MYARVKAPATPEEASVQEPMAVEELAEDSVRELDAASLPMPDGVVVDGDACNSCC